MLRRHTEQVHGQMGFSHWALKVFNVSNFKKKTPFLMFFLKMRFILWCECFCVRHFFYSSFSFICTSSITARIPYPSTWILNGRLCDSWIASMRTVWIALFLECSLDIEWFLHLQTHTSPRNIDPVAKNLDPEKK